MNSCLHYHESLSLIKKNLSDETKKNKIEKKPINNISLKNINYFYIKNKKKIHIINNFSLNFQKGKIYGLFGKSGKGKTTLLNIISGLIKPKSGNVSINNKKIKSQEIYNTYKIGLLIKNHIYLKGQYLKILYLILIMRKKKIIKMYKKYKNYL